MEDLFSLEKTVAVITGGFGQLGQEFCNALVSYGSTVAVIDIVEKPRTVSVEFSRFVSDGKIKVYKADITKKKEIEDICGQITVDLGVPNILINNAAIDSPPNAPIEENGPFETYPIESLQKILDVNIVGVFVCSQVFGDVMAKNGKGSIINISSIYGNVSPVQDIYEYKRKNGIDWYKPAPYALTKSAILNFTRYLATYWAKKGVRVNSLSPAGIFNNQEDEFLKEYYKRIPIGRMANANELNGAIVFLASDASSYMTGANLIVDGGWTAW